MRSLIVCAVAVLVLSAAVRAYGAGADKAIVTVAYTASVAPAGMQAYEAGVKAYNQCLGEHGVRFSEYAVSHETGRNTYEISYYAEPMTWSQWGELGSESAPCAGTFDTRITPYLEGESGLVMVQEPELSHLPAGRRDHAPARFVHIFDYTLNSGPTAKAAFTDAVRKIAAAAARMKWPHYWDTVAIEGGGEGAPDFQLAIGSTNWAGVVAAPDSSLWRMVASAFGQTTANAIRKSLDDSIKSSSDYFGRYNADLSYLAGK